MQRSPFAPGQPGHEMRVQEVGSVEGDYILRGSERAVARGEGAYSQTYGQPDPPAPRRERRYSAVDAVAMSFGFNPVSQRGQETMRREVYLRSKREIEEQLKEKKGEVREARMERARTFDALQTAQDKYIQLRHLKVNQKKRVSGVEMMMAQDTVADANSEFEAANRRYQKAKQDVNILNRKLEGLSSTPDLDTVQQTLSRVGEQLNRVPRANLDREDAAREAWGEVDREQERGEDLRAAAEEDVGQQVWGEDPGTAEMFRELNRVVDNMAYGDVGVLQQQGEEEEEGEKVHV